MAKQYKASADKLISWKQFNFLVVLVNTREITETDLMPGTNVPILKIVAKQEVIENGQKRNDWVNIHPSKGKLNALMASDLIDFMVKLPNKSSNNGPVEDGGTAPIVNGWDNF
jgi:hypothetical protein